MYSFNSTVRFSECDSRGLLSIPALINYLQDCSTFHTESIGHGIEHCNDLGFAWFIAAWHIYIERLPSFTEEIRTCTWSFMYNPMLATRHFLMETLDGEPLATADSLWFPFDLVKGRPIRVPNSEMDYLCDESPLDLPPAKRKVRLSGEGSPTTPIAVAAHHLDTNKHVNNGQYIAMAEAVVRSVDEGFEIGRLHVQYKQAATLGNVIVPHVFTEDTGYAVDLASDDGTSFAVVRMERR